MEHYRDLTLMHLSDEQTMVVACDSSAAIGYKPSDHIHVDPFITARFCVRVTLLELLSFGAKPLMLTNVIGNEWMPTGKRILEGIQCELERANLSHMLINGSTEENMQSSMTSIGITMIGLMHPHDCIMGMLTTGVHILQLGKPYVGGEVLTHMEEIFSYDIVCTLRKQQGVLEIVPVGSKGILYEAEQLAQNSHLTFQVNKNIEKTSLIKSAGPATVLLIAVSKNDCENILKAHPYLIHVGVLF